MESTECAFSSALEVKYRYLFHKTCTLYSFLKVLEKNSHISIRTAVKISEPRAKELCLTKDVLPASDHDLTESSNDTLRKVITCRSRKQTRSRKIIPGVYLRQKT